MFIRELLKCGFYGTTIMGGKCDKFLGRGGRFIFGNVVAVIEQLRLSLGDLLW
jgi:hypothetical protein